MINTFPIPRNGDTGEAITRFDGAIWHVIDTPTETLTLTSAGRSHLVGNELLGLLDRYLEDASEGRESPSDVRQFIAEGGNARVFAVGDSGLAIKEKREGSHDELLPALLRMDRLAHAIETGCPRWISIPHHYGVCVPKENPKKEMMLMEKVDGGITVGDVLGAHDMPREKHLGEAVLKLFGQPTESELSHVEELFSEMKLRITTALEAEGLIASEYLTDIHRNYYNVIIEPLDTPIAGRRHRLSIIDQ